MVPRCFYCYSIRNHTRTRLSSVYRHFLDVFTGFLYLSSLGSRLPRLWLHILWLNRMLLRSMCEPPFETGMISSASGDIGCSTQPSQ